MLKPRLKGGGIQLLADPGIITRLLLESPCLIMRYGLEKLLPKIGSIRKVILTGGAVKSKAGFAPQMYADILGVSVVTRMGDEEGTAKGAAVLAAYMAKLQSVGVHSLPLAQFAKQQTTGRERVWEPNPSNAKIYDQRYHQFAQEVGRMQMGN